MWRPRKLKLHQPVYLIRETGWWSFSFLGLHILDLEHLKVLGGLIFFLHTLYFSAGGWATSLHHVEYREQSQVKAKCSDLAEGHHQCLQQKKSRCSSNYKVKTQSLNLALGFAQFCHLPAGQEQGGTVTLRSLFRARHGVFHQGGGASVLSCRGLGPWSVAGI